MLQKYGKLYCKDKRPLSLFMNYINRTNNVNSDLLKGYHFYSILLVKFKLKFAKPETHFCLHLKIISNNLLFVSLIMYMVDSKECGTRHVQPYNLTCNSLIRLCADAPCQ